MVVNDSGTRRNSRGDPSYRYVRPRSDVRGYTHSRSGRVQLHLYVPRRLSFFVYFLPLDETTDVHVSVVETVPSRGSSVVASSLLRRTQTLLSYMSEMVYRACQIPPPTHFFCRRSGECGEGSVRSFVESRKTFLLRDHHGVRERRTNVPSLTVRKGVFFKTT